MIVLDIKKRSIGINFYNSDEAEIVVWAPKDSNLSLVIDGEGGAIANAFR